MPKPILSKRSRLGERSMEELLEEIEEREGRFEEPLLRRFESFVSSIPPLKKPCEPQFLVSLVRDLFYLMYLVGHEITQNITKSDGDVLPRNVNEIANFLSQVLDQCRRLHAAPDLFPSQTTRAAFLTKIGSLCSILESLDTIFDQQRSFRCHQGHEMLHYIGLVEADLEEMDLAEVKSSLLQAKWPMFHPHRPDAKHPWNNWLDNSAKAAPEWIAIQQKIPRFGDRMNKKKYLEYDTIESVVEEDQLLPRDQENDWPQIPAVGHEFKHMTWSGFATVPKYSVGFNKGTRKAFDAYGVVTLEHLNRALRALNVGDKDIFIRRPLHGQPRARRVPAPHVTVVRRVLRSNVPFFRFAMAYKP